MKCQIVFLGKIKNVTNLSSAELAQRVAKAKILLVKFGYLVKYTYL